MEQEERQRKGDVYREIKAGAVFRAERGRKRSELAAGVYVDTPAPDSLRYVARRTAKGGFAWLLYDLALQCGLEQARASWSCLVTVRPGCGHQAAEHFPGAVQIVDLYHAKEHVWDVAHAVFGYGTAAATAWATHACSLLEQGHSEALVSAIEALASISPEPGHARSIPERAVDYFTTNAKPHALSRLSRSRDAHRQWHRRGCLQNHRQYPCQTLRHAASLPRASMLSCLCALLFSMEPMIRLRRNMLPDCLQLIHTPLQRYRLDLLHPRC